MGPDRFGFVARLEITDPTAVSVRQVDDCALVLDFLAAPGSIDIVRRNANGSATVDLAGATEGGGYLHPTTSTACQPPDTATVVPGPKRDAAKSVAFLALSAAFGLLLGGAGYGRVD